MADTGSVDHRALLFGAVKRDDASAAESEIVLQPDSCAIDLALLRGAAQLLRQLETLREARGTQWMPLR